MSSWKTSVIGVSLLLFTGCSGSDTLEILIRDQNALDAEIIDSLAFVTDEDSAKNFLEVEYPRLKVRADKLKSRWEMYEKYSDEKRKLEQAIVFAGIGRLVKDKVELTESMFDKAKGVNVRYVIFLLNEAQTNLKRIGEETLRINTVAEKLRVEKALAPAAMASEFPNLSKLRNPYSEVFGGKTFFGKGGGF